MIRILVLTLTGLFLFTGGIVADVPPQTVYHLDVEAIPGLSTPLPVKRFKEKSFPFGSEEKGWIVRVANVAQLPIPVPTPAVAHGHVILSAGISETRMFGLDAETGRRAWTTTLRDNGPSTVAVHGRTVAVNTQSCTTYTLDAVTGKRYWGTWVGPSVNAAPTIFDGKVYAAHSVTGGASLSAMSLKTGKVLWRKKLARDIHGAPVVASGVIYVAEAGGRLLGFNDEGKQVVEQKIRAASAPWADGKGLYIAVTTGTGMALSRIEPGRGETKWSRPLEVVGNSTRTVATRRTPSRKSVAKPIAAPYSGWGCDPPRPVVIGDRAMLAHGRELVACDAETGKLAFRARLPEGSRFHSPPAVLGKNLLFGTLDGLLVEIDTTVGAVRRAFDVGHPIVGQPVVAKGKAYVVAVGCVICVPWGKADGPEWPQWGGTATRSAR